MTACIFDFSFGVLDAFSRGLLLTRGPTALAILTATRAEVGHASAVFTKMGEVALSTLPRRRVMSTEDVLYITLNSHRRLP